MIVQAPRDEPALIALAIAHEPALSTGGTSPSLAEVTVLPKPILAIQTLPVILKVSLLAFITCCSVLALQTVLIDKL